MGFTYNGPTRACPFCAEDIKVEAKVCPHCRQWLTLRSIRNPSVAVWVYGVPHLAIYFLLAAFVLNRVERFTNPKPNYSSYIDSLRVLQSQMISVESSNGPRIYVTGILTNQSDMSWRDIEFECRFYDGSGDLIDAAHPHVAATIQAHDDTAFRAVVAPGRSTNDYVSFRISVVTARNTKGIW
jgi:hypothetical protein